MRASEPKGVLLTECGLADRIGTPSTTRAEADLQLSTLWLWHQMGHLRRPQSFPKNCQGCSELGRCNSLMIPVPLIWSRFPKV